MCGVNHNADVSCNAYYEAWIVWKKSYFCIEKDAWRHIMWSKMIMML